MSELPLVVDALEIQMRVRQPDGNYVFRWVSLQQLMYLLSGTAFDTFDSILSTAQQTGAAPADEAPPVPPE